MASNSHIASQVIAAGLSFALASVPFTAPIAYAAPSLPDEAAVEGGDTPSMQGEDAARTSENLQAQLQVAYDTLGAMHEELEQAQGNLSKLVYDIEQTTAQIESLNVQIAQNNDSLTSMQKELATSIAQSYKAGKPRLLDFIFGSDSMEQLTSKVFYQNKVEQDLANEISRVRQAQISLDNEKVEVETLKLEQERQKANEEQKSTALEEAASQQKLYIDHLNEEIKIALERERLNRAQETLEQAQRALLEATDDLGRTEAEQARDEAEMSVTSTMGATVASLMPSIRVPSTATTDQRSAAVNAALSQLGCPYVFGCETPGIGFDCNGLAHWSWQQAGVEIPYPSGRTMYGQFQWLRASGRWVTSVGDLLPGDLVFFSKDGGETIYHVALYVGGGLIVHAAGYQWGVLASPLDFCTGFCGGGSPL